MSRDGSQLSQWPEVELVKGQGWGAFHTLGPTITTGRGAYFGGDSLTPINIGLWWGESTWRFLFFLRLQTCPIYTQSWPYRKESIFRNTLHSSLTNWVQTGFPKLLLPSSIPFVSSSYTISPIHCDPAQSWHYRLFPNYHSVTLKRSNSW